MEQDLPYRAEYAKSARASCRGCKSNIGKDTLRLAVMVQSAAFDGKTPQWYHFSCFYGKQRPKTVDDIQHFESLRWEDQEKIKEKITNMGAVVVPPAKGKGKKRASSSAATGPLQDFKIEYSKSSRALCRGCEQKVMKDEVRISKKDFESEVGRKYGGQDMWHHLNCFAKLRSELGFYVDGSCLPGYNSLNKNDKTEVEKQLPAIKQEEVTESKKMKKDDEEEINKGEEIQKAQAKLIFKYRDLLKSKLAKKDLQYLLEANEQEIPSGEERMLDRLSDLMAFGRLLPCSHCKNGQLVFNKFGYECKGDLTEWTKCHEIFKEPPREKFVIPKDLQEEHSFLKKYKCVIAHRVIKDVMPTVAVKKQEEDEVDSKPKVERNRPPLYNMEFVILGTLAKDKDDIKKEISKLGGKVTTKISRAVMAVISNKDEVEKMGARMTSVKDCDVHVVSEEFLKAVKGKKYEQVFKLLIDKAICDWGSDPKKRVCAEPSTSQKSKSIYTKSVPKSVTMKLKGGTAVDPDSGLEDCAHVYISGEDKYTAVLGITDIQLQKNSYYKLQILKSDNGNKYWLFRAWGRTGTTIGGNKLEQMGDLMAAKEKFHALYEEKSGNDWHMRDMFQKVPGRLYPIDVDYTDETDSLQITNDVPSNLPSPVQTLMRLIFNIDDMKRVMLEFELDTEKMPLGKLSKSQIKLAYGVLSELQKCITDQAAEKMFIDASNRFYTYIPHSAGVDALPILKHDEQIKQKIDMMDNLMELEIAYSLMKSSTSGSVDAHYEQLKAEIGVLERESVEFATLEEYVKNTHAPTHDSYEVVIKQVFTVQRQGEEKRFKPFKKMPNRKLLWHGSRITNFAGIISQGLRIAPPEAPVTGYMFGKGIYFADMVTKSANYCCTTPTNNTGLLLLCDVALGQMMELKEAKYVEKLPKGKHSCKGIGMTCPDPAITKMINDEIEVPVGKPTKIKVKSSLLYNEYIVYDVAQVNCKYLVHTEFKYKKF